MKELSILFGVVGICLAQVVPEPKVDDGPAIPPPCKTVSEIQKSFFHPRQVLPQPKQARNCTTRTYLPTGLVQIKSPNSPNVYPNGVDTKECFSSPPGTVMTLTCSLFDLESQQDCAYDKLSISVSGDQNLRDERKFCGTTFTQQASNANSLVVAFHTDGCIQRPGYSCLITVFSNKCTTTTNLTQVGQQVEITSPNYPSDYPNNVDTVNCFSSPAGTQMTITCNPFDLEYQETCVYDKLIVSASGDLSFRDGRKFCGTTFTPVTSNSNQMTVAFKTDSSDQNPGYKCYITSVASGTGPSTSAPVPGQSSTGAPNQYSTGDPDQYSTGDPYQYSTGNPDQYSTEYPYQYSTGDPDQYSTEYPHQYSTGDPYQYSTGDPDQYSTEYPYQYSTGDPDQYSTGDPDQYSTEYPYQYSTGDPYQYSTGDPDQYSTEYPYQYSTGDPYQYSTGDPDQYSTEYPYQYSTGDPDQYSTEYPYQYSTGDPDQYSTEYPYQYSTGDPDQYSTGDPDQYSTEYPYQYSTGVSAPPQSSTRVPAPGQSSTRAPSTAQSSTRAPATAQSSTRAPATAQSSTRAPATAQSSTRAPALGAPAQSSTRAPSPAQSSTRAPSPAQSSTRAPAQTSTQNPGSCQCGKRNLASRIVNGTAAKPNEFPWRCYLRTTSYDFFCGCAVISPNWIMTARHCTAAVEGQRLFVVVGAHIRSTASRNQKTCTVDRIENHPQYNSSTMDNDISLLHVSTPIAINTDVSPVCLPWNMASTNFSGTTVSASGWGTTSSGGSVSNTLMEVDLPVLTSQQCSPYYPGSITNNMICTYQPGKDTCQGDSGGSIDYRDPSKNRYYGIGVVSWGIGCAAPRRPGVYAKVTNYLSWIASKTQGETFCRA